MLPPTLRWAYYACVLTVVGAAAFRLRALPPLAREGLLDGDETDRLARRAAGLGLAAGILLLPVHAGRLWLQTWGMFGPDEPVTLELARVIALQTRWGTGWASQVATAALVAVAWAVARRGGPGPGALAGIAALGTAATVPLTGHAVAEAMLSTATVAQVVHVTGAGLWLGTLAVMVLAGIRGLGGLAAADRARVSARMVESFSPLALLGAALLGASGLVTSWLYLDTPGQLLSTAFGRMLLLKVAAVAAVVGLGFVNWRRVRPALGEPGSELRLLRTAGAELLVAALVLAATAVLVSLPMPHEMG